MNQCDGCKLGLPIENGIHIHPDITGWNRYHMCCTKNKYRECDVDRKDNLGIETELNPIHFSEHSCGSEETE